ncbi:MAG: hypothetical protein KAH25_08435 [Bacteroidales bacterium]|nr:hypothetical protein [Bacteroidales bacterium]
MKIAYIISKEEDLQMGDCLSSAKMFYVFDTSIATYTDVEIPKDIGTHQKALRLSEFLKSQNTDIVVGVDIGPKAKSAIEENGMQWHIAQRDEDFKTINNKLKNI